MADTGTLHLASGDDGLNELAWISTREQPARSQI